MRLDRHEYLGDAFPFAFAVNPSALARPLADFGRLRTRTARPRVSEWMGAYTATLPRLSRAREIGKLAVELMGLPGVDLEDVSSYKLHDGVLDHLDAVVLPVPDKESCSLLVPFVSRGGKVYASCRTQKQRDAVKAFPAGSVVICDDENAIVKTLEKFTNP